MRSLAVLLALLVLGPVGLAGDARPGAKALPAPPVGIRWERDFQKGMRRAVVEGHPILFCVNALEGERANDDLAQVRYRSAAWGEATRGYVAFACNPNDHRKGNDPACTRYEDTTCSAHIEALDFFLKRFGPNLITPQHVILEPDGDVAFRKEYFTGVVGPVLLDSWLSALAPRSAQVQASIRRQGLLKELAQVPPGDLEARAALVLSARDGLAAATLVNALDDSHDEPRRLALIRALRKTPARQLPVALRAAEERVLWPQDEPTETLAWVVTLFAADRPAGVWAATRVIAHARETATTDAVLRAWAGRTADAPVPGVDDLPEAERPAAYEALLLARDPRVARPAVPASWTAARTLQIRRARAHGAPPPASARELAAALATPRPGPLRRALLGAPPEVLRAQADAIVTGLGRWRWARVRVAGALALLAAGGPHQGLVVPRLLAALDDPIEGPDTRALATRILGSDPGPDPAAWKRALEAHLAGAGR
jgi:hypothetical protein